MLGGRMTAEWLKTQGVTHVFALCGEHVLPFLDGCEEAGIRVIGTRHEQGAVLAAEAFARVTGRPGVAAVTAGPGVTNAATGLAVANSSGSPVLLLAGRTSTPKRLTGTFQDIDGRAITQAVTKWNETVFQADRLPAYLESAWRRMLAGRPGAVMLELPHDVQTAEAEAGVAEVRLPEPSGASPQALRRAIEILGEAEHPVAVVGSGAFWSGAADALKGFAERTQIPVATLNAARGLLPDGHECCIGPLSEAGLALTAATVSWTAGSWIQARSVGRVGSARFVGVGLAIVVVGIAATALVLSPAVTVWWSVPAFALAGLGMGLAYSPLSLVVLAEATPGAEGTATAGLQLSDTLGTALGTGVAGAIIAAAARAGAQGWVGLALAFAVAGSVGLVGIALSPRLRARRHLAAAPVAEPSAVDQVA